MEDVTRLCFLLHCSSMCAPQGGPKPEKLLQLWQLLLALRDAHPAAGVELLNRWPLIPSQGARGSMVRIAQRALVFCPPSQIQKDSTPAGAAQRAKEESLSTAAEASVLPVQELSAASLTAPAESIAAHPDGDVSDQETQPLLIAEEPIGDTATSRSIDQLGRSQQATISSSVEDGTNNEPGAEMLQAAGPWDWLLPVLERLSLPVLDPRFSMLASVCALDGQLSEQDTILRKLQLCCEGGLFQVGISLSPPLFPSLLCRGTRISSICLHEDMGQQEALPCRWTSWDRWTASTFSATLLSMSRATPTPCIWTSCAASPFSHPSSPAALSPSRVACTLPLLAPDHSSPPLLVTAQRCLSMSRQALTTLYLHATPASNDISLLHRIYCITQPAKEKGEDQGPRSQVFPLWLPQAQGGWTNKP